MVTILIQLMLNHVHGLDTWNNILFMMDNMQKQKDVLFKRADLNFNYLHPTDSLDDISCMVSHTQKCISRIAWDTYKHWITSLIAGLMGSTWGPPGDDRTQVGPCWPHEPCYLGVFVGGTHARWGCALGPLLLIENNRSQIWISNHIHWFILHVVTHPCFNLNHR